MKVEDFKRPLALLNEEELRRLASLVQAEINARVLRKKLKGGG